MVSSGKELLTVKKELPYFEISHSYGGNQDWFSDITLRIGGCAAVAACDSCIYFDRFFGTHLYPFDPEHITRKEYTGFAGMMKPYLHPRWTGIDRLELFIDGFMEYIRNTDGTVLTMKGMSAFEPAEQAAQAVTEQIDSGYPIPFLNLHHRDPNFRDYDWHWFLLNGYERWQDTLMVKAVTYGSWRWLDFHALWNTGRKPKGGMILYSLNM